MFNNHEFEIREQACRAYKNLLSCCPEHLRSVLSAGRSIEEELTSRTAENYFRAMSSSTRGDIAEISELDLDVSDGRKTARTEKDNSRALSRAQRNEASSTCKTGDAVSKTRKRKGKLRSFASKSTIATKDTSLVGRREIKRRRHRGRLEFSSFAAYSACFTTNVIILSKILWPRVSEFQKFQRRSRRYPSTVRFTETSEEAQRRRGDFSQYHIEKQQFQSVQ